MKIDIKENDLKSTHRALKPKPSTGSPPRDVIIAFVRESTKERILREVRQIEDLNYNGSRVYLYPDLAAETIKQRFTLRSVCKKLAENGFKYTSGFAMVLLFV
uniref:Uncharacterized protein n=1 Tax=Salvator merianae TaxID=96440 RepID=A0A8D0B996_SALMN